MRFIPSCFVAELEVKIVETDPELPTIIFLHDSLGCIKLWRDFPELLAKKSKCNYLVYDRLGYGESTRNVNLPERGNQYLEDEADFLITLLNDLKIQKPILFGHSDGGTIALIAAAKKPQLIQGVITEGAHVFTEELTLNGIRDAKMSFETTNLREKLFKYHRERVDEVVNAWINIWLHESFKSWNVERYLPQLICPSLIIQGENDAYGTLRQVDAIINGISGVGEKLIIADIGHSPHKENQEEVLKNAVSFIERIKGVQD